MSQPTVIEAVRRFLPAYLSRKPPLSTQQRRAIWAMLACRSGQLGGHVHRCAQPQCQSQPPRYTYHSCNHKSCPLCGRGTTQQWVQRQEEKRVNAPHFMVTFTVPEELRPLFFGDGAKQAFDKLFAAASHALSTGLERNKQMQVTKSGFTMVLHTWNQQMLFHPHIHIIIPGAGLDAEGRYKQVKNAQFLVAAAALKTAYRARFRELMGEVGWQSDPAVWRKAWAVNVQAFGSGENAIKYLGRYVGRSVIGDRRIVAITETHVTYKWKDRSRGGAERVSTIEGIEFVKRYLRHVLPKGLHSVRYHGFHHPTAKKTLHKMQLFSGQSPVIATKNKEPSTKNNLPKCPCCQQPMERIAILLPVRKLKEAAILHLIQARAPPQAAKA